MFPTLRSSNKQAGWGQFIHNLQDLDFCIMEYVTLDASNSFHIETKLETNVLDACGVGAESRTAQLHESMFVRSVRSTSGSQT